MSSEDCSAKAIIDDKSPSAVKLSLQKDKKENVDFLCDRFSCDFIQTRSPHAEIPSSIQGSLEDGSFARQISDTKLHATKQLTRGPRVDCASMPHLLSDTELERDEWFGDCTRCSLCDCSGECWTQERSQRGEDCGARPKKSSALAFIDTRLEYNTQCVRLKKYTFVPYIFQTSRTCNL